MNHHDQMSTNMRKPSTRIVVPFLLGAVVGGVAGAVAGTLLCHQTTGLATAFLDIVDRRLNAEERERLRFDLMLQ
jgi:cell division protein FtsX